MHHKIANDIIPIVQMDPAQEDFSQNAINAEIRIQSLKGSYESYSYCDKFLLFCSKASKDEQWKRAMDYLNIVSELNYMTQIVIMLYEDPNKVKK